MPSNKVKEAKMYRTGAQWQHKYTKESYEVVSVVYKENTTEVVYVFLRNIFDGLKRAEPVTIIEQLYTYIPPMKGAYK